MCVAQGLHSSEAAGALVLNESEWRGGHAGAAGHRPVAPVVVDPYICRLTVGVGSLHAVAGSWYSACTSRQRLCSTHAQRVLCSTGTCGTTSGRVSSSCGSAPWACGRRGASVQYWQVLLTCHCFAACCLPAREYACSTQTLLSQYILVALQMRWALGADVPVHQALPDGCCWTVMNSTEPVVAQNLMFTRSHTRHPFTS
jgi:hypothetical protein